MKSFKFSASFFAHTITETGGEAFEVDSFAEAKLKYPIKNRILTRVIRIKNPSKNIAMF
jgi:hypothetical protein